MATVGDASSVDAVQSQIDTQEEAVNQTISTDVVDQFASDMDMANLSMSFQHFANMFNLQIQMQSALEQLMAKCVSKFTVPQG